MVPGKREICSLLRRTNGEHQVLYRLGPSGIGNGVFISGDSWALAFVGHRTTLQVYAHGRNEDRMTAQGDMLTAFFAPPTMVQ